MIFELKSGTSGMRYKKLKLTFRIPTAMVAFFRFLICENLIKIDILYFVNIWSIKLHISNYKCSFWVIAPKCKMGKQIGG